MSNINEKEIIRITGVDFGLKKEAKLEALRQDMSLKEYIITAIKEKLERDASR
jgi:predicted HicB family RNase H-like nuclease